MNNNTPNKQKANPKSKQTNHAERYIKASKTISNMSKEEIEQIIENAKQSPMKYMSEEETAVVTEICRIHAIREVENISPEELSKKGKELYKKHVNAQKWKGDHLTIYESSLLARINTLSPIALNEIDFSEDGR